MKKFPLFYLIFLTLCACGDEVEFNTPAIQGNKNGDLWRAQSFAADIDFGGFLLEGRNNSGTLQLVTATDTRGTFALGGQTENVAIFKDFDDVVYSTANEPDPSLSLYPVEGEIIIEDIYNTVPKTITGRFWFYAYSSDGLGTLNFNEGVFYKVPLLGGLVQIEN